eukprot:4087155-Prymnesium_polylepis.1
MKCPAAHDHAATARSDSPPLYFAEHKSTWSQAAQERTITDTVVTHTTPCMDGDTESIQRVGLECSREGNFQSQEHSE